MRALVIGATGATGKDLVNILLQDPDYTEVVIFIRRASGIAHPKLLGILTDFDKLEEVSGHIRGDVLFCCLGTTLRVAGSKDNQRYIDYEIPAKFAEIAKTNGVSRMVLLSAYGAAATSKVFYSKIKGQLEEKIARLAFDSYIVFRPGLLLRRDTDRPGERVIAGLLRFLNSLGLIRKFRPLPTSTLAEKMARSPKVLPAGNHVIELDKIIGF